MNFNKYTIKSQEALQEAAEIAKGHHQQFLESGHLLKAMLSADESIMHTMLKKMGINIDYTHKKLDALIATYPKVSDTSQAYLGKDMEKLLKVAEDLAAKSKDEFVSIDHLLLAMLKGDNKAGTILKDQGADAKVLEKAIAEVRGLQEAQPAMAPLGWLMPGSRHLRPWPHPDQVTARRELSGGGVP